MAAEAASPPRPRRALILVENLSAPFDRRVWRESLALRDAGYQVVVICPKGDTQDTEPYACIEDVHVYRYRPYEATGSALSYLLEYGVAMLAMSWLCLRVALRHGFDTIQLCNPPDTLILVALPYKLLGKKILFDQHDLSPDLYVDQKGGQTGGFMYKALLFFERLTYRWSDVVFTVNESCRGVVLERGGVDPERAFVVRNGPDRRNLDEGAPNPSFRRGKTHLLTYVGMMGPQDGVDVLLRVVQRLREEAGRNDFHVRIIGAGTYLPTLEAMAVKLGVDDCVEFTGRISHGQVMEELASADVCVCPDPKTPMNDKASLIKVVEYMAKSKPIVAFELNEVMIMAGDAALYAPAGDEAAFTAHVQRLLEDPGLREELGQRGRQRVLDGLTWEQSKEHLYAAYDAAWGNAECGMRNAE